MILQSVEPANLGAVMLKRAAAIRRMKAQGLDLDWLKEFDIEQLTGACDRMEQELTLKPPFGTSIQRELIQNPAFARYLGRLLPLLPDDSLTEMADQLDDLLESCQGQGFDVTVCNLQDLVETLEIEGLTSAHRLAYLVNFAPMVLTHDQRGNAINSLRHCVDVPMELTHEQQDLLLEPYTSTRHLFSHTTFREVWGLLEHCPDLHGILLLLHDRQVVENLGVEEYSRFAENAPEYLRLLTSVADTLDSTAFALFLRHWQKNECSMDELKKMERYMAQHPDTDWGRTFFRYSGYVNEVYGHRFKNIDLSTLRSDQEDILLYAITHGKSRFIRLVDENPQVFAMLPAYSILLQDTLCQEHLNLNELTAKDLADCAKMRKAKLRIEYLAPSRRYTFTELRALYGLYRPYMDFYHALRSDSQDYRLRVFREVCKQKILDEMAEDEMQILANSLSEKPLSVWKQEKFSHIGGLTSADAARLLIHMDGVSHLLSGMRNRNDALLALRNLDALARFGTMEDLKEHLTEIDQDWHGLAKTMGLTPDFKEQYRETIVDFLSQGGAAIAMTYMPCLDTGHKSAYLRVVKAELMGKLRDLKYFEGDLQRELDAPISNRIRANWPENMSLSENGIEAGEHDGFFSTMLLGTQPQHTCLAYGGGAYRKCLLSAFDSNKKVVYARQNGRIVGRAFLRLTKGRMADQKDSGFSFVDLEDITASRGGNGTGEQVVLFLERPYISGVGPEAKAEVVCQMIELAKRKADALGVLLVLSREYAGDKPQGFTQTRLCLYISKSKGGAQYLDSLDGEATVLKEGSYSANTFLVKQ